jgi:tetratricopeptide (TPR) repeat protein
MFFKKFFAKSYDQFLQKGDSCFKDGHYSEARHYYADALEKIDSTADTGQQRDYLHAMIRQCGDRLAEMNIVEAENALRCGNPQKASECLELSLELADDVTIREKAEMLITTLAEEPTAASADVEPAGKHGCSSCQPGHHSNTSVTSVLPDHLHEDDQFLLLVNTLPGDLPQRYASLGEEFASAYLLAYSGESGKALDKFIKLPSAAENDIILYETALLEYKEGRNDVCESLLRKALRLNADNPACNLSLAQILTETGRLDEAVVFLKSMMERMILFEQSLLMLADIYSVKGDHENAITLLNSGLQTPALKKAAAERLVAILSSQNRGDEAAFLIKTYLKGCC